MKCGRQGGETALCFCVVYVLLSVGSIAPAATRPSPGPTASLPADVAPVTDVRLAAAWDRYYATLADLRRKIEASDQYREIPQQRAKAFHALMEIQAMVYNFAVAPRMQYPRVFHNTGWQTDMYTMGGNGPDFDYHTLFLSGKTTYRFTGKTNDSRLVLGQLSGALPGTGKAKAARNYDFSGFQIQPDGSFEIIISATPHQGNWIQLDPASDFQWILLRPTVDHWNSVPAEFQIEKVGPVDEAQYAADEFDPAAMAHRIDMATSFARYMVEEWVTSFYPRIVANAGGLNRLKRRGKASSGEVTSPTAEQVMGGYDLKDNEALLIELLEEPQGVYWSFQLFDIWLRSIDFRNRQTTLNQHQIAKDADGKIRVIVSRNDPGIANWLDTGGFSQGMISLRNYGSPRPAKVTTKVVKVADLPRLLPQDTRRVTPDERSRTLGERRLGYLRRHDE